ELRVRASVRPVADVQPDLETAGGAESLFGDELWPEPDARIAAQVLGRGLDGEADLRDRAETEALLDAQDPHLAVQRDGADALRAGATDVVRVPGGADVVHRVAAHEDDRQRSADHDQVGDAVVEAEGALERVANERVDALPAAAVPHLRGV